MDTDTRSISFDEKMILKKFESEEDVLGLPGAYHKIIYNMGINNREFDFAEAIASDVSMAQNIIRLIHLHLPDPKVKTEIHTIYDAHDKLDSLTFKAYLLAGIMEKLYCDYDKIEWQHAFSCALLLAELVKNGCIEISERFIVAAFLHDIGKLVFNKLLPKKYQMMRFQMQRNGQTYFESENAMFKINHAKTGFMLLKQCDVSPMVYLAVQAHHAESASEKFPTESLILQLIDIADRSARGYDVVMTPKEMLEALGWEDFDLTEWTDFQTELIEVTSLQSPPPPRKEKDEKEKDSEAEA